MLNVFILGIIQIIIFCLVNYILINYRYNSKKIIFLTFILSFISAFIFLFLGILGIFIPLIILIILNYKQTKDTLKSVIIALYSLVLLVSSEHLTFLLDIHIFNINVGEITSNSINLILHTLIFSITSLSLCIITKLTYQQLKIRIDILRKYVIFIFLLIIISVVFIYANIILRDKTSFSNEIVELNSYVIFVYIIFIIIALGFLMSSAVLEVKAKNKQEEYRQLLVYSEDLEQMYEELQRFRHDYINILATMSQFIREKDFNPRIQ